MAKNGRDTKHTRNIARRMHFVRNGEKCKMHKIEWCEGGFRMLVHELLNKDPDMVPKEAPLTVLDSKSAM